MKFDITFNKPTVTQHFDEKTAGVRVRVVNGRALLKPVNREYGSDVFPLTPRKRGGVRATINGNLADMIINHTPLKEGVYLTLEKQPYGWLAATPYTGAKEDLSRFVPVARIWRVEDEIVSKTLAAPTPQKRGPGRPRKNQVAQPTVPAVTSHFVQKPATVESATETIMMMPVNPSEYKGPMPVPVVVQKQVPQQKQGPGQPRKNLPVVFVAIPQHVASTPEANVPENPSVENPTIEAPTETTQESTQENQAVQVGPEQVEMVQVPMVPVQTEPVQAETPQVAVSSATKQVGRPSKSASTMIPRQWTMNREPERPRKIQSQRFNRVP